VEKKRDEIVNFLLGEFGKTNFCHGSRLFFSIRHPELTTFSQKRSQSRDALFYFDGHLTKTSRMLELDLRRCHPYF